MDHLDGGVQDSVAAGRADGGYEAPFVFGISPTGRGNLTGGKYLGRCDYKIYGFSAFDVVWAALIEVEPLAHVVDEYASAFRRVARSETAA